MSLTAWKTWASGDILTAADMNTYVRDNGRWLSKNASGGSPKALAYHSVAQNGITTATMSALNSELFDPAGMHDPVTSNSRLTVPTGGDGAYLIGANVQYAATPSAANAQLKAEIALDASAFPIAAAGVTLEPTAQRVFILAPTAIVQLSAADYVQLMTEFTNMTGVNIQVNANWAGASPQLWAVWLGEN